MNGTESCGYEYDTTWNMMCGVNVTSFPFFSMIGLDKC
jgi:hypothetical protein